MAKCRYAAIRLRTYIGRFLLAKTIIELKGADLTLGSAAASVH
ncbi:ABC transporter ATP-binding protein, partial [Rhizobium ruizarguesonis]